MSIFGCSPYSTSVVINGQGKQRAATSHSLWTEDTHTQLSVWCKLTPILRSSCHMPSNEKLRGEILREARKASFASPAYALQWLSQHEAQGTLGAASTQPTAAPAPIRSLLGTADCSILLHRQSHQPQQSTQCVSHMFCHSRTF